ncbi:MAG TPA: hypothetical protein VJ875_13195 [Pyrinomonadaceae bacterium]|nr:hypothetical protein [Pyrinomonadaceae bacterium]
MKSTSLFRCPIVAVIVVCLLSSFTGFLHAHTPALEESTETTFVLNQFRDKTLDDCVQYMDRLRPKALTADEKKILKAYGFDLINKHTEINDPALLDALYQKTQRVLEFHHRAGIVEYLLFKNHDPVLMTKAGAFIAISNRALKVVKDDQALSGIIAHELSHEYFALQFLEARNARDYQKLRIIELMCDALSTITMLKLDMNPDKYSSALEKIIRNSEGSEQLNDGSREMPSLESRLHVIAEIKNQFSNNGPRNSLDKGNTSYAQSYTLGTAGHDTRDRARYLFLFNPSSRRLPPIA